MSPDRVTASPSLSQTPSVTNDLKELNIGQNSANSAANTLPNNDNNPSLPSNNSTESGVVATVTNNSLGATASPYPASVFNGFSAGEAFESKASLTLSPSHLNGHAASYGAYGSHTHGAMDFGASGYAGGFYPGTASVASVFSSKNNPFGVTTSSPSPGDKNKNKRSNTGKKESYAMFFPLYLF